MWGVLSASETDGALVRRWRPLLAARLDGLVTTGPHPAASSLQRLLTGLRAVPAEVDVVVYVEAAALQALTLEDLDAMTASLADDVAAVARAAPVTDALKRVEGDRLVGTADRAGLLTLATPLIVRRSALGEALEALPDGPRDPAALLVAAGHPVRAFQAAASSSAAGRSPANVTLRLRGSPATTSTSSTP